MDLSFFDDQCVRVTLRDGSVFEGACQYNSAEFNEAEIGPDEDGLEIGSWLFCRSDIETVELIDENNPYLAPFGTIEEETVRDGADAIEDSLIDGDPRSAERLLNCLEHCLTAEDGLSVDRRELKAALKQAVLYAPDDGIRERCETLLNTFFSES